MKNDGKTYIWIPSVLTLWQLNASTAAMINAVHSQIGKPTVAAGDLNPYYFALNDLDMGGAPFTRDATPGMAVCGPIENLTFLPIEYVQLITLFGGDVEGLPLWFEIADVKASVPQSLRSLASGTTWETWGVFGESHKPTKIGAKLYRSNAYGESGQMLLASQCLAVGVPLLMKSQYQAIQPVLTP